MANDLYKTKDKEKFEFKLSPTTEQIAAKQSELQRDARLTAQNGYNTDSLKNENNKTLLIILFISLVLLCITECAGNLSIIASPYNDIFYSP